MTDNKKSRNMVEDKETKIDSISEWMSGFFDGDGSIDVKVFKDNNRNVGYGMQPRARLIQNYMGGLVDSDGYISVKVSKSKTTEIGFRMQPMSTIVNSKDDYLISFLDYYSNRIGFDYSVNEMENKFSFNVTGCDNVKVFVGSIMDNMIVKRNQAEIMIENIIPMIESKMHLNKTGFIDIMEYVDKICNMHGGNRERKYTSKYFRDKWKIEKTGDQMSMGDW